MEYTIELKNSKKITCKDSQTILDAALDSGITLEHSCLSARCRSCMVQVTEGKVIAEKNEVVLSQEERDQGYTLSCNSRPASDLKLNAEDLGEIKLAKSRTIPAKIDAIEEVGKDVVRVELRLPPNVNFLFEAGQYVNLIKGNIRRSYSIANYLREDSKLEFYIKRYEGGMMSKYWFDEAKKNDLLRMEGPLGTFFYRKKPLQNIILLATGTGIAPVKAILEQFAKEPELLEDKKITLLWGGRFPGDHFWEPLLDHDHFEFIPVLSRSPENWDGAKGYVQDVLLDRINNLSDAQVYACGSDRMISSAREKLIENGLPEEQFFSDAFLCSN